MQLKSIRVGRWYRARHGDGQCLRSGGTHPPSVQLVIHRPFPRGRVTMTPRDVIEEIPAPPTPEEEETDGPTQDC